MVQYRNFKRVIGVENHSKDGTSQKILMSKRIIKRCVPYLLLISVFLMQSCATMALRGSSAKLTENSTYQGIDVQMTEYADLKGKFQGDLYVGAGKLNLLDSDLSSRSIDNAEVSKWNLSVGLGGTYYITKKRFQPFAAFECHLLPFFSDKSKTINDENDEKSFLKYRFYGFVTPKAGFRFYLSNRIALQGSMGYHVGLLKIKEQKDMLSGFTPSVGICFVLANM